MTQNNRASPEAAILIIEDDDVTATRLQDDLFGAGYVVRRAGSAAEALTSLKSTPADLILMKLMLPDTDGLILCSTLKATFPAPIILLSTRASEVDRALAMQSGALDCMATTVDVAELLEYVRAAVQAPGVGQKSGRARY
ncbi:MAG: response regulator [Chloroflexota bacterium]|nr:response regulator [Chloroflexota bacterium]